MYAAINKYGWDNFEHVILFEGLSEKEAKDKEKELISEWHTQDRQYGYNATAGGDGLVGWKASEETRALLSKIHTGMKESEETRRKKAKASKRNWTITKDAITKAKYKAVNAYDPNGVFVGWYESITDAANSLGLSKAQRSHISDCCNKTRNTSGGYRWEYA